MEKKLIIDFLRTTNERHRRRIERKREFNRMLFENALKFHQHTMANFQATIHLAVNDIINGRTITGRKIRVAPQNDVQESELLFTLYSDSEYLENFHINRNTFNYIVTLVRDELDFNPNFICMRKPLSVEFKTAIALHALANNCQQSRVISKKFGISQSSAHKCLHNFLDCMAKKLPQFICIPLMSNPTPTTTTTTNVTINNADDHELREHYKSNDQTATTTTTTTTTTKTASEVAEQFQNICKIPNIIGCIYTSDIILNVRRLEHISYLNKQGDSSIIVQTVVDADQRFINVSCIAPGSTPHPMVLKTSELYKKSRDLPKTKDNESYMIIGGKGYPLLKWLLIGYDGSNNNNNNNNNNNQNIRLKSNLNTPSSTGFRLTPAELHFNTHIDLALKHCETAMLNMKNRWQILSNSTFMSPDNVTKILQTCCVLHNICINQQDDYFDHHYHPNDNDVDEPMNTVHNLPVPLSARLHYNNNYIYSINDKIDMEIDKVAQVKRELIKNYLSNQ